MHPTWLWGAVNMYQLHEGAAPTCGTPSAQRTCEPWRRGVGLLLIASLSSAVLLVFHGLTATQIW